MEEMNFGPVSDDAAPQETPVESETIELFPTGSEKREETETTDKVKEEDNEKRRYQYWQSQADKLKNELEKTQQKLKELEPLAYLRDFLTSDPELLNLVSQRLHGKSAEQDTTPPPPEEIEVDETLKKLRQYQDQVLETRLSKLEQRILSRLENLEKERQLAEQRRRVEQIEQDFLARRPEAREDFDKFRTWATEELKNLTIDDWYEFYKMKTGQVKQKQQRSTLPSIAAVSRPGMEAQPDENDDFNKGLMRLGKSPW